MEKYNQIFNGIFKQSLFDENSKALIEKATQQYPYFSAAQLFLLHLTDKDSYAYAEQAKKTSLLFNNNYWLNFQLLELSRLEKEFTTKNQILLEPTIVLQEEDEVTLESENNEPTLAATLTPMAMEDEIATNPIILEEQSIENKAIASELTILQNEQSIEETVEDVTNVSEISSETTATEAEMNMAPIEAIEEVAIIQHINVTDNEAFQQEQPSIEMQDEDELPVDGDDLSVDDEMKQVSSKIAETLSAIAIDTNNTNDTITFEPLHTSDYFASVGIRLSEEIKPSDKLGLQMKSFTQWLKTMKKLHADQLSETSSTDNQLNEQSIQQLAEASNKENMVVTEAMAEVLLQQGKIIKAIEVYEKLSLLDPSKKAYFAAKLKQLKG